VYNQRSFAVVDKILWRIMKNLSKRIFALYCRINNSLIFVASSWFHSTEEGILSLENEFYLSLSIFRQYFLNDLQTN